LGESYDPAFLARVHLGGVQGNVSAAIFWYQRAGDLGMSEADLLLGSLQAK
jgi:TPR repeat protein